MVVAKFSKTKHVCCYAFIFLEALEISKPNKISYIDHVRKEEEKKQGVVILYHFFNFVGGDW